MRRPSARVLSNLVTLYRFAPTFDVDGGVDGGVDPYPGALAAGVPASVQLQSSEVVFEGDRPTRVNVYNVFLGADFALRTRDRIDWVDGGVTHTLYVDGSINAAGKGSSWEVTATEKS